MKEQNLRVSTIYLHRAVLTRGWDEIKERDKEFALECVLYAIDTGPFLHSGVMEENFPLKWKVCKICI